MPLVWRENERGQADRGCWGQIKLSCFHISQSQNGDLYYTYKKPALNIWISNLGKRNFKFIFMYIIPPLLFILKRMLFDHGKFNYIPLQIPPLILILFNGRAVTCRSHKSVWTPEVLAWSFFWEALRQKGPNGWCHRCLETRDTNLIEPESYFKGTDSSEGQPVCHTLKK